MFSENLERGTVSCRCCSSPLNDAVLSLGLQPISNALLTYENYTKLKKYPLELRICSKCQLGQIGEYEKPEEIFQEYTYLSSTSTSWLNHAKSYVNNVTSSYNLNKSDLIIEIASNDGYLLQYFQQAGYKVLGIEPAKNVASLAIEKGIPTQVSFFGKDVALDLIRNKMKPKLVVCNNVLAHVPDINDFMEGLAILVNNGAILSVEAPSMLILLENNLFDTIYHEHFSYLSVISIDFLTKKHGLVLYDVDFLNSHGGSYRYWIGNSDVKKKSSVEFYLKKEENFMFHSEHVQEAFRKNSQTAIKNFRDWCLSQKSLPIGFGAAAKATVLLNAAKISAQEFAVIADNSLLKQKKLIPGVNVPISSPSEVFSKFDGNLVIFPWNLSNEITSEIKSKYPKFKREIWTALPNLKRIS